MRTSDRGAWWVVVPSGPVQAGREFVALQFVAFVALQRKRHPLQCNATQRIPTPAGTTPDRGGASWGSSAGRPGGLEAGIEGKSGGSGSLPAPDARLGKSQAGQGRPHRVEEAGRVAGVA